LIAKSHICACSTNLQETSKFGIDENNVFGFWDFVGGRFSVWSAIGVLPLSVHFGYDVMEAFLQGGHSIDVHFLEETDIKVTTIINEEKHPIYAWSPRFLQNQHPTLLLQSHRPILSSSK
jgi:glucose-6-phosphate isomerase